ncbi:MAG: leucyl aminopeptidase [Deltaproteobacteria bacterium]|nr:MAG: leucyl aminopeptidase [Deltaproteobacteria bacterium]
MKFTYVSGAPIPASADVVAVCAYTGGAADPGFRAVDKALDGLLTARMEEVAFRPERGQTLVVRPAAGALGDARAVVVVGGGDRAVRSPAGARDAAAAAVRRATALRARSLAFVLPAVGRDPAPVVQFAVEGARLGAYRFDKYRSEDANTPAPIEAVTLVGKAPNRAPIGRAIARGEAVADAVCLARDLINEPAATMTPAQLAAEARAIAKRHSSLTAKILGPAECKKLGMGMLLAVGQGSDQEVRVVHLTYKPKRKAKKRIALVGKGITFDSGGYSLKPTSSMLDMKIDMSGAAAVIAAMDAIARIGSPYEVHAVAACAENLVSGKAYKLGDVLRSMSGKTVEINNTDAEGRLALGDALYYVRDAAEPDEIFDFATLTGACLVALGPYTAGVMSNRDALAKAWLSTAARVGEDMWHLPLNERLMEQLKSPIADLRNTGGRAGGALTAGLFLKQFVGDVPWVHVDIAGPASASKTDGAISEGGTGFGVATIVAYACP